MASLLEQGIQNFENENFQKAIKLFEKILKSDPDNSEAIINKTSCLAYPYHEFTKNVAGDFANVKQFLPSGVEACSLLS